MSSNYQNTLFFGNLKNNLYVRMFFLELLYEDGCLRTPLKGGSLKVFMLFLEHKSKDRKSQPWVSQGGICGTRFKFFWWSDQFYPLNFWSYHFQMVDFGISLKSLTKGFHPKSSKIGNIILGGPKIRQEKMKIFSKDFFLVPHIPPWQTHGWDFRSFDLCSRNNIKTFNDPPPPPLRGGSQTTIFICVFLNMICWEQL